MNFATWMRLGTCYGRTIFFKFKRMPEEKGGGSLMTYHGDAYEGPLDVGNSPRAQDIAQDVEYDEGLRVGWMHLEVGPGGYKKQQINKGNAQRRAFLEGIYWSQHDDGSQSNGDSRRPSLKPRSPGSVVNPPKLTPNQTQLPFPSLEPSRIWIQTLPPQEIITYSKATGKVIPAKRRQISSENLSAKRKRSTVGAAQAAPPIKKRFNSLVASDRVNSSGDAYHHGFGALGLTGNVPSCSPVPSRTRRDGHQLEQTDRYRSTVSKATLSDIRDPDPSVIREEDSSAVTASRLLGLDRVDWKERLFCLPVVQPRCPSNVLNMFYDDKINYAAHRYLKEAKKRGPI